MEDTPIEYTFQTRNLKMFPFPAKGEKNGVFWTWKLFTDYTIYTDSMKTYLMLKLEWPDGIVGFQANCKACLGSGAWINRTVLIGSSEWSEWLTWKELCNVDQFHFEFSLTPVRVAPEVVIEHGLFEPAPWTDAVLVVEGVEVHVMKGLLAFHSDYFHNLFFGDFKEKTMKAIPIEDVKYHEFIDLLKIIYLIPKSREFRVEPILKLADRFLMPSVTIQIETELIDKPYMRCSKLLRIADKYGLHQLVYMVIAKIGCAKLMGQMCKSSDYEEFSDRLKAMLLDKMSTLIDKMDAVPIMQRVQSRKRGL